MTTYSITLISKTSLANHFDRFLKTFTGSNSVSDERKTWSTVNVWNFNTEASLEVVKSKLHDYFKPLGLEVIERYPVAKVDTLSTEDHWNLVVHIEKPLSLIANHKVIPVVGDANIDTVPTLMLFKVHLPVPIYHYRLLERMCVVHQIPYLTSTVDEGLLTLVTRSYVSATEVFHLVKELYLLGGYNLEQCFTAEAKTTVDISLVTPKHFVYNKENFVMVDLPISSCPSRKLKVMTAPQYLPHDVEVVETTYYTPLAYPIEF